MTGRASHVADMFLLNIPPVRSVMRLDRMLLASANRKPSKAPMKRFLEMQHPRNIKG